MLEMITIVCCTVTVVSLTILDRRQLKQLEKQRERIGRLESVVEFLVEESESELLGGKEETKQLVAKDGESGTFTVDTSDKMPDGGPCAPLFRIDGEVGRLPTECYEDGDVSFEEVKPGKYYFWEQDGDDFVNDVDTPMDPEEGRAFLISLGFVEEK